MSVDAFRRRYCRMAQELLDVLHRDPGMPTHRRAGVTQVMETDHSQIVLLEELLERPGHPVDFVSLPILPNEDIVVVSVVARPPEGLLPLLPQPNSVVDFFAFRLLKRVESPPRSRTFARFPSRGGPRDFLISGRKNLLAKKPRGQMCDGARSRTRTGTSSSDIGF